MIMKVVARRIIAGKWACNNGQACIGVDYVITTKDFASKLVKRLLEIKANESQCSVSFSLAC